MQRAAANHWSPSEVSWSCLLHWSYISDFLGFYFPLSYFGLSALILSCPHSSYIYYAEGKERKGIQTQHPSVTALTLDKLPPCDLGGAVLPRNLHARARGLWRTPGRHSQQLYMQWLPKAFLLRGGYPAALTTFPGISKYHCNLSLCNQECYAWKSVIAGIVPILCPFSPGGEAGDGKMIPWAIK